MKTQIQFQIPNSFEENFGSQNYAFFRQAISDPNWLSSNINRIIELHPEIEDAKIIYEIANLIGSQIIENELEKVIDLPQAYNDIICEAVYSADKYEIAKEIYKQYLMQKQIKSAAALNC